MQSSPRKTKRRILLLRTNSVAPGRSKCVYARFISQKLFCLSSFLKIIWKMIMSCDYDWFFSIFNCKRIFIMGMGSPSFFGLVRESQSFTHSSFFFLFCKNSNSQLHETNQGSLSQMQTLLHLIHYVLNSLKHDYEQKLTNCV